ncbi:MAG: alternative ribosome rescue aminoacyl-tRNA hydrolase ArfB [Myxococcota bacterium]|jgi:ribosome-associated protein|nr:alternative ribosome rescue aminoacyl-tRNA hydrolase ArfB [Myxococcota bacterium]
MAARKHLDLVIEPWFSIPESELGEAASRARGPGGQHVNKTNTRVTLRWNVASSEAPNARQKARLLERLGARLTAQGDLVVHSDRTRSRARNREYARDRIRELVASALHEDPDRRPTRPTRASKQRTRKTKTLRSQLKKSRGRVKDRD